MRHGCPGMIAGGWIRRTTYMGRRCESLEGAIREEHEVTARELAERAREIVRKAIEDHCAHREWPILVINVRTNHVHVVVTAGEHRPEVVMGQLKAWATRRLREARLRGAEEDVWAREGSTRYLYNGEALAAAVDYVVNRQGEELR
jgi:REP element-mobilizing transposase RayT